MRDAIQRLLGLLVGAAAFWAVVAFPASRWSEDSPLELTALVGLGCVIPAMVSLLVVQLFRGKSPEEQLMGAIFSIGVRAGLTLAAGVALFYLSPLVAGRWRAALVWGLVFYLVFMTIETSMVYSLLRGMNPGATPKNGS